MKCPYCKKEMKIGYIYSGKTSICFTPEGEKPSWLINKPNDNEVLLAKLPFLKGCRVKVNRCENCKIELIDENDL